MHSSVIRQTDNGSALDAKQEPEIKASHEALSPSNANLQSFNQQFSVGKLNMSQK